MRNISVKAKVIIVIATLFMMVLLLAGILLMPRVGKNPDDYKWNGIESFSIDNVANIDRAEGNSDIKILQITDTQFDIPFKSIGGVKSDIDKLVADNKPDLITVTGDLVGGPFTHFYINDVIKMMDSYKIPWAPVFGNHDRELNANLYYLSKQLYKSEYCLFKEGPNNIQGVGNYVINIRDNGKIVYTVYMMDSNGDREYIIDGEKVKGYDNIHADQIAWYTDNVKAINAFAGYEVPSMAFFHIPLPEYRIANDLVKNDSPEAELIGGEARENPGAPPVNSGFFDKMLELGSTTHVFVGHDHINDFTIKYKGIYLTYGVKTGNFSTHHNDKRGGTLITIRTDGVDVDRKLVAQ